VGLRLAGAVCGNCGAGRRVQQPRKELTHSLTSGLARLAEEREAAIRCVPMWDAAGAGGRHVAASPVEDLPIDLDWWVYAHHRVETRFSWAYAGLNALYLLLGLAGLWLRPRFWRCMLAYLVLRSAMLLTVAAPEARYTLECFPMLFTLGGIAVATGGGRPPLSGTKILEWSSAFPPFRQKLRKVGHQCMWREDYGASLAAFPPIPQSARMDRAPSVASGK